MSNLYLYYYYNHQNFPKDQVSTKKSDRCIQRCGHAFLGSESLTLKKSNKMTNRLIHLCLKRLISWLIDKQGAAFVYKLMLVEIGHSLLSFCLLVVTEGWQDRGEDHKKETEWEWVFAPHWGGRAIPHWSQRPRREAHAPTGWREFSVQNRKIKQDNLLMSVCLSD